MKKQRFAGSKTNKLGFSLMELSIVILVIGILVLGITKGSTIIYKARIGSAQALTKGSPAASIPDMIAWYETSLSTAFPVGSAYNATLVATWIDNSPKGGNNAVQATSGDQPTYADAVVNSLPALRFGAMTAGSTTITANNPSNNANVDFMTFDASALNGSDYTIFVVEQRRPVAVFTVGNFLGLGGTTAKNTFGYTAAGTISTVNSTGGTAATATVTSYTGTSSIVPRILTFYANNTSPSPNNKTYIFVNGTLNGTGGTNSTSTTVSLAASTGTIGDDSSTCATSPCSAYTGDIAEIIIYARALTLNERNDIQYYLAKKYSLIRSYAASTT